MSNNVPDSLAEVPTTRRYYKIYVAQIRSSAVFEADALGSADLDCANAPPESPRTRQRGTTFGLIRPGFDRAHTEEEQCSTWLYLWFCSLRVCGAALRSTAWPIEGRHDERRAHAAC
ncbi:hypothetical protein, partial [Rhodococcus sp. LB1]|uniref:hypothetical protein n=1 Tax=Rhodococcus sp. LB1 TaxID=1807499 RepID=UPI001E620E42